MDVMHANYCNDVIVMAERSLSYTKIVQVRAKSSSLLECFVERSLSYVKICDQFPLKVSRLILRCNSYVTHM